MQTLVDAIFTDASFATDEDWHRPCCIVSEQQQQQQQHHQHQQHQHQHHHHHHLLSKPTSTSTSTSTTIGNDSLSKSPTTTVSSGTYNSWCSYKDAAQGVRMHTDWLEKTLKALPVHQPQPHKRNQTQEQSSSLMCQCKPNTSYSCAVPAVKTVVAYLSHNTLDYFLSVLACSGISNIDCCLLHTRWTAQEMVHALQLLPTKPLSKGRERESESDTSDGTTTEYSSTILLYGQGWQTTAHQVQEYCLQSQQRSSTTTCIIQCLPIPLLTTKRKFITGIMPTALTSHKYDSNIDTEAPLQPQKQKWQKVSSDDAVILFTSGTTSGTPKGVRLSHRAIYVQCLAKPYTKVSRLLATTISFSHVGGLNSILAVWCTGGTVILTIPAHHQHLFNPETVLQSLQFPLYVNVLVVVPAMLYSLEQYQQTLQQQGADSDQHHDDEEKEEVVAQSSMVYDNVQLILIGGQSAETATRKYCRRTFPQARLIQTYACTEAASSLTFLDITKEHNTQGGCSSISSTTAISTRMTKDKKDALGNDCSTKQLVGGHCVGRPPQHIELCLLEYHDTGTKSLVIEHAYVPGIIATRGPHVMNGYWQRNDHCTKCGDSACCGWNTQVGVSITNHNIPNWLRTSDFGYWDEYGNLYFCGRVSDSIRTGGETVLATEVENVLLQHPSVQECAVFAVPDRKWGEMVACAIVLQRSSQQPFNVRDWCASKQLAKYKCPFGIRWVDTLPKNASGKVLKYKLVEQFIHQSNPSRL